MTEQKRELNKPLIFLIIIIIIIFVVLIIGAIYLHLNNIPQQPQPEPLSNHMTPLP